MTGSKAEYPYFRSGSTARLPSAARPATTLLDIIANIQINYESKLNTISKLLFQLPHFLPSTQLAPLFSSKSSLPHRLILSWTLFLQTIKLKTAPPPSYFPSRTSQQLPTSPSDTLFRPKRKGLPRSSFCRHATNHLERRTRLPKITWRGC